MDRNTINSSLSIVTSINRNTAAAGVGEDHVCRYNPERVSEANPVTASPSNKTGNEMLGTDATDATTKNDRKATAVDADKSPETAGIVESACCIIL